MYIDFSISTEAGEIELTGYANKTVVISKMIVDNPTKDLSIRFRASIDDVMENIMKWSDNEEHIAEKWISDDVLKAEYERRFIK